MSVEVSIILTVSTAKGFRALRPSQPYPIHFSRVLLPYFATSPSLSPILYPSDTFPIPWAVSPFEPARGPDIHGVEFERKRGSMVTRLDQIRA